MRLTGNPPRANGTAGDRPRSITVLPRAVELGVNHIDTAAFCLDVVNLRRMRQAVDRRAFRRAR
jgi:pyridoxine 4-dehydrogenase